MASKATSGAKISNQPLSSVDAGIASTVAPPRGKLRQRRGLIWAAAFVMVLAAVVGLRLRAVMQRYEALMTDIHSLEALSRDPERLLGDGAARFARSRANLAALRGDLWPLPAMAARLGWVPGYGADLAALAPLLEGGDHTLAACESLLRAVEPLAPSLLTLDRAALTGPGLGARLAAARPAFEQAYADAEQAARAWEQIDPGHLSPAISQQATQARMVATSLPGITSLGLATIDLHAAISPLLPYIEGGDAAAQLLADGAALPELTLLSERLPRARTSAERAAADLKQARLDALPAGQQVRAQQLTALPGLYLALIGTAEAASATAAALMPILTERDMAQPFGAAVVAGLLERREAISEARQLLDEATATWAAADLGQLPPALRQTTTRVPEQLANAGALLDLAAALPGLLGAGGGHDYLVLAQSGDELRPTGGFITSAGVLSLRDGRIAELRMEDSSQIDRREAPVASPYAPEPMGRYLEIYRWVLGDANWSPDFPTSARMASMLYGLSGRTAPRDVIALDIVALQELLRAVGPVTVAGEAEPISADTVLAFFERRHGLQNGNNGAAVADLAGALLQRVERGEVQLVALLETAHQLLERRDLQIAVGDPGVAEDLAALGWDGAVRPGEQDYLMVVDANVGYTKSNRSIRQELSYTVDLSDLDAPVATLVISYTHTTPATTSCAELDHGPPTYSSALVRCYRDYLRVLTPGASSLLSAENEPSPGEWTWSGRPDPGGVSSGTGEAGTRAFAAYFALPQGGRHTVKLRYSLPVTVVDLTGDVYRYTLHAQKQAGREAIPLRIQIHVPSGARVVETSHTLQEGTSQTLNLITTLDQDQDLTLRFQVP